MKRILLILLAAALFLTVTAVFADEPISAADALPFTDVTPGDWFYSDVKTAWENGLINGISANSFAPDAYLTCAEAVKLAACMNQLYTEGEVTLASGDGAEWYLPYVDYCFERGILTADYAWNTPALRSEYMEIFASALPDEAYAELNAIPDSSIPNLASASYKTLAAVYKLYRAGIVQGSGSDHDPSVNAPIKRSEVAAILTRMLFPATRVRFDMSVPTHSIVLIDGITYVDGILIANKTYSLPADYAPGGLTPECEAALNALSAGAAADGLSIYPISTYRSYEYQEGLYNRYVARDGKAEADRYSARPGYSEHQTGLAVDVNSLEYSFADTAEGKWLAAHCHEYGFILRYPADKEEITGYRYEPWHIRYLGVETATKVAESGLTLEEYLGITSAYAD